MIMIQSERLKTYWSATAPPPSVAHTHTHTDEQHCLCVCLPVVYIMRVRVVNNTRALYSWTRGRKYRSNTRSICIIKWSNHTHTRTVSPPSVSADSAGTSVMFAGLMMAFIYHGNAHEAVRGALADVGGIPDMLITCCTSLNRDVCSAIAAVKESVRMAWCMLHVCDGWGAWGSLDILHRRAIKDRSADLTEHLSKHLCTYPSRPFVSFPAGDRETPALK